MSRRLDPRTLIWASLALQAVGFAIDAVWHGALHPDFEAPARAEMLAHLASVHAVFLVGILALVASTAWGLWDAVTRSGDVPEFAVALAAALVQVAGQAWDLSGHLHQSHGPPISWAMIVGGPLVVAVTLWVSRARHRGRTSAPGSPAEGRVASHR